MKKILSFIITSILLIIAPFPTYAASTQVNINISAIQCHREVEFLSDGSYFISEIETTRNKISLMSTTTTKSKKSTYYDVNGAAKWYVKVTGTFTYGNGTSKCINAYVTCGSYDSSIWKISTKSASKTGNKAIATASAIHYLNGKNLGIQSKTVTLTCNSTGKVS